MRRVHAMLVSAVAMTAALLLGAIPAHATVVDRGHFSDPISFTYDDCGFDVSVEGAVSGHYRVRAGTGSRESAFFLLERFSFSEVHTNEDTGESLTLEGRVLFNEIKATHVEGNIFEFVAVEAGQPFVLYDADGNLVLRDRGSIHHRSLFDTGGDDQPGGEFIEYLGAEVHGPHPAFGPDFCEIITPLIGS